MHQPPLILWRAKLTSPDEDSTVSALALMEMIMSAGALLFLWPRIGAWHVLVAIVIVPMFMLRTADSTQFGHAILATVGNTIFHIWRGPSGSVVARTSAQISPANALPHRTVGSRTDRLAITTFVASLALYSVLWPVVTVTATLIKMVATLTIACKHPVSSIAAVPGNFYRYCLCMDISTTPELVPGVSVECPSTSAIRPEVRDVLVPYATLSRAWTSHRQSLFWPAAIVFFIVVMAPAMAYRFVVKASVIIYWPLLLSSMTFFCGDGKSMRRTVRFSTSSWIRRVLALVNIFAFALKVVAYSLLTQWPSAQTLPLPVRVFIDRFVVPSSVPWWQWASVVNALCVWVAYVVLRPPGVGAARVILLRCMALLSSVCVAYFAVVHYNFLREYWSAVWSIRIPPTGEWWPR
jgi:hypothetical protein